MEVNLLEIRQHGGSQQNAWEELAYQVRPAVSGGHAETRKTRAPDAGVEWYEVYDDGHVEGFQAKFHTCLADALGGMRESVTSACAKRSTLTRLTFVLPYDFTDTGEGKRKSDQDRWADAVKSWEGSIPGAENVEFRTLLAGDVLGEISRERHSGRRAFWFGVLELPDEWFERQLEEARAVAGERYTPEADTDVAVNLIVEAAAGGDRFLGNIKAHVAAALAACRRDTGIWGAAAADANTWVERLDAVWQERFFAGDQEEHVLHTADFELVRARKAVDSLLACTLSGARELPDHSSWRPRNAQDSLHDLSELLASDHAAAYVDRALAVIGPAGSGKTHTILRVAERLHAEGTPVVVLHGQRFTDTDWWTSVRAMLDIGEHRAADFLEALDSLAEARGRRAVILIDALNESKDPRRWSSELVSLLTQAKRHPHLAVVVSFRNDYRSLIEPPKSLAITRHNGFRSEWLDAVAAYCRTFEIAVPSTSVFDPGFASPLFLRMWCEVVRDRGVGAVTTRSDVFEQFAAVRAARVTKHLSLAPTSDLVGDALNILIDKWLESGGQPLMRSDVESIIDALLPHREWPSTLFSVMHSEGLIELYPWKSGDERVALPFQAFSEHLVARRLVADLVGDDLASAVSEVPWLWRALAVILPEQRGIELVDVVGVASDAERLMDATRDSLVDRHQDSFSERAIELLKDLFAGSWDRKFDAGDILIGLAPRLGHPGNADWLHEWLVEMSIAERDAIWSIGTYTADENSASLRRLKRWAISTTRVTADEEIDLAVTAFMWLLTSPNRHLRDTVTRSLTDLLSRRLAVGGSLLTRVRTVDDPYVQERVLLACYGALMVAGDQDLEGARVLCAALASWPRAEFPVHVLARDSARGMAHWAESRGVFDHERRVQFDPPFTAAVPTEPPTADALEAEHGVVRSGDTYGPWRAYSILSSCLTWMGDFHKYVMKSDIRSFSQFPLSGPEPASGYSDPLGRTDAEWSGRWIAARAIAIGWTPERFEDFEHEYVRNSGRESHKAERFGKKYQWIALHELLARLADNFHLASDIAGTYGRQYEGPWIWYGRDLDPCLPLPQAGVPQHLALTGDTHGGWAILATPDIHGAATPDEWVDQDVDLNSSDRVFSLVDEDGNQWIALHRYASWDRDNAARTGMSKRERDIFHLHFSWLVPAGEGGRLLDLFRKHTLRGRWMDDTHLMRGRYIGELGWAPVAKAPIIEEAHFDRRLQDAEIRPEPAIENYLWEGNVLDCSLKQSVDFYVPADALMGTAVWHGKRAEWLSNGKVVARSLEVHDGDDYQSVLVADPDWLRGRLAETECDLVVGVLGERYALPLDDNEFEKMAWSDFWYAMVISRDGSADESEGPVVTVQRTTRSDPEVEESGPA